MQQSTMENKENVPEASFVQASFGNKDINTSKLEDSSVSAESKPPSIPMRTRTSTGARQKVSFKDLSNIKLQQDTDTLSKVVTRARGAQKRENKPLGSEKKSKIKRSRKAKGKKTPGVETNPEENQNLERVEYQNLKDVELPMLVEEEVNISNGNEAVNVEMPISSNQDVYKVISASKDVDEGVLTNQNVVVNESKAFRKTESNVSEVDDELPVLTAEVDLLAATQKNLEHSETFYDEKPAPKLTIEAPFHTSENPVQLSGSPSTSDEVNQPEEDEDRPNKSSEAESPIPEVVKPKRKKNKGRNGNIYIGVLNRVEWFSLQKKFGFDNVNTFGQFVMEYMHKVHEDFDMLHQVALKSSLFEEQGLSSFQWINGLPHPVNESGSLLMLPAVDMTEEKSKQIFDLAYDLALQRPQFLMDLAQKISQQASQPNAASGSSEHSEELIATEETEGKELGTSILDLEIQAMMDDILDLHEKIKQAEDGMELPEQKVDELVVTSTLPKSEHTPETDNHATFFEAINLHFQESTESKDSPKEVDEINVLNFQSPCPESHVPTVKDAEMSFQPTTNTMESKCIEVHVDNAEIKAETEQPIDADSCLDLTMPLLKSESDEFSTSSPTEPPL